MGGKESKLSEKEIQQLEEVTQMNRDQLQHKFQQFMQMNPTGVVDKETYLKMTTSSCGESTRYMFERIFDVWDTNHDGLCDFKEFITSTSVMMQGTLEQKLRFAFDVYDANGDGHLSLEEMTKMISAAFAMVLNAGDDAQDVSSTSDRVQRIMEIADTNRDGLITWEEFAAAARKEPALLEELGIAGLV